MPSFSDSPSGNMPQTVSEKLRNHTRFQRRPTFYAQHVYSSLMTPIFIYLIGILRRTQGNFNFDWQHNGWMEDSMETHDRPQVIDRPFQYDL